MPGTMCAVACCKNNLKATKALSSDVSFHTFPKDNEPQRLKIWISKTKRTDSFNPKTAHICSEHFLPDDFERNLQAELLNIKVKRQLKKSAVPSLKLSVIEKVSEGSENRLKRIQKRNFRSISNKIILENQKEVESNDCYEQLSTSNESLSYNHSVNMNPDNLGRENDLINWTIMPRNYQRKRIQKWTIQDIKNAINDRNINKKSYLVLEKEYGIPKATLTRYSKRKIEDYPVNGGRFKNIFSHEQLIQLKDYLTEIDRQSKFGLKKVECQKLIYDFAVNNNIPHRFSNITKLASKDWMMNFMKNYGFSLRKSKTTSTHQMLLFLNEEKKKQMRENILLHRRKVLSFLESVYNTDFKAKVKSDPNELIKMDMFSYKTNGREPIPKNIKVNDELDNFDNYESDESVLKDFTT